MAAESNAAGITREATQAPPKRLAMLPAYTGEYSREKVLSALEGLYALGGDMRTLACMYGERLQWTPPHLRAGALAEADADAASATEPPAQKKQRRVPTTRRRRRRIPWAARTSCRAL